MIKIKTPRQQYYRRREVLGKRLKTLVPSLMEETGTELWLSVGGDFAEEPVLNSLTVRPPIRPTTLAILNKPGEFGLFCDWPEEGEGPEFYTGFKKKGEDRFEALGRFIAEKNPANIALNMSDNYRLLDGLSHNSYLKILKAAGPDFTGKIISSENLAMRYMETRLEEEFDDYREVCDISRQILRESLTHLNVEAGKTTTADLEWLLREKVRNAGMDYSWGPDVNLQRIGDPNPTCGFGFEGFAIEGGDLLHVDFGVCYMGYESDMQYLAYVLKPEERDAPAGLHRAFDDALRLQDIFLDFVKPGLTGNGARRGILALAEKAGLEAMVYSHPVGLKTHSPGPQIGRFAEPGFDVFPLGEYVIHDNSCFTMELNVRAAIPEWGGQKIFIYTEDDIAIRGGRASVLGRRQEKLILI